MEILSFYSHKQGLELIQEQHATSLSEITIAVQSVDAVRCLAKISKEMSKIRRWGGLLFSPLAINYYLKSALYPLGWAGWNSVSKKFTEPAIYFPDQSGTQRSDRFRRMDGLKNRVGLEIQLGKYAFMGYDIFSKFIIFRNKGFIDYGIEIVLMQEVVDRMSTGVSAFEHIMIDFQNRGEADIDVPVAVLGIGLNSTEWTEVNLIQQMYRENPDAVKQKYPDIGLRDLKGYKSGPK